MKRAVRRVGAGLLRPAKPRQTPSQLRRDPGGQVGDELELPHDTPPRDARALDLPTGGDEPYDELADAVAERVAIERMLRGE